MPLLQDGNGEQELTEEPTAFKIADHLIRWDGKYNWVVEKPVIRTKRESKEQYLDVELVGYYSTLHQACIALFDEKLRNSGPKNVSGLAQLIEYAKLEIIKSVTEGLEAIDKHIMKVQDNTLRAQATKRADEMLGKNPIQHRLDKKTGEVRGL